jgi:hypothetical protein
LQPQAWENIELNLLKVHIDSVTGIQEPIIPEDYPEEMKNIMKKFLEIVLPNNGNLPDMWDFLDVILLPYIASDSHSVLESSIEYIILNSKLLYDVLRFIIRYHSKNLPASFFSDMKGSERLRKICLFEEKIGLCYSATYSEYTRYQVLFKNISPAYKQHYGHEIERCVNSLTDSNENRKISNFEITENNNCHNYPELQNCDQYKLENILTEKISDLLQDGSAIDVSDRKLQEQIKRYVHQNEVWAVTL